jgi:hypothetical protein
MRLPAPLPGEVLPPLAGTGRFPTLPILGLEYFFTVVPYVLMIKFIGCSLITSVPVAALALTAVPRTKPVPTPIGE